jgi:hypothetical protein
VTTALAGQSIIVRPVPGSDIGPPECREVAMQTPIGRVAAGVWAVFFLVSGVWAIAIRARSTTDRYLAPYNEHFTRDAGAFQVGIGVSPAAVLFGIEGIPAVLAGGRPRFST